MGVYHCGNCGENHDSDERPPIFVMMERPAYNACEESLPIEPDPICANCRHWPKADREKVAEMYANGADPAGGPYWGGQCSEIGNHIQVEAYGYPVEYIETDETFGCNRFKSQEE